MAISSRTGSTFATVFVGGTTSWEPGPNAKIFGNKKPHRSQNNGDKREDRGGCLLERYLLDRQLIDRNGLVGDSAIVQVFNSVLNGPDTFSVFVRDLKGLVVRTKFLLDRHYQLNNVES